LSICSTSCVHRIIPITLQHRFATPSQSCQLQATTAPFLFPDMPSSMIEGERLV